MTRKFAQLLLYASRKVSRWSHSVSRWFHVEAQNPPPAAGKTFLLLLFFMQYCWDRGYRCVSRRKVSLWNCKMIEQLAFATSSMISTQQKKNTFQATKTTNGEIPSSCDISRCCRRLELKLWIGRFGIWVLMLHTVLQGSGCRELRKLMILAMSRQSVAAVVDNWKESWQAKYAVGRFGTSQLKI